MRRLLTLGVAIVIATATLAVPTAHAAFPGANGRLVFERESVAGDHTQTDLFTIGSGGSRLERLTDTPDRNEFGPAWNAAGTRIAFWRTPAPFGAGSIWVADANGKHQRRLTRGFDARDPAWNPAGTRIVFTRVHGSDFDLWTLRASDGGDLRRLTSGPALDFEPAWSPNGRSVAFTRGHAQGDPGDIYVEDVDTGDLTRVTRSGGYDHQVAWAPGGRRLVFERDGDVSAAIVAAAADGTQITRLTHGGHFDTGPAYSPDRRLISFGSDRGTQHSDLWLMNADGSGRHLLRHVAGSGESFPDWRPRPS